MTLFKNIFTTPLLVDRFKPPEGFNDTLFKLCQEAYKESNQKLTDEKWDDYNIFDWKNTEIQKLKKIFVGTARLFAKNNWGVDLPWEGFALKGWANYRERNSFHGPHIHANTHLALTYYVKTANEGGAICFFDSRSGAPYFDLWGPNEFHLYPEESMIVAFPAYVQHMVAPVKDGARLSITCNLLFPEKLKSLLPDSQQNITFK
ncbi:hypothetical protein AB751O23_AC_00160 [Chlamydiales bacterium SCGC AB-751-O23]|jgi:hypothetical protein|nr:hypothetical protein AB751O23_AC_00160 [Chlamydiales bacterium SCGC AB-751-O23]